MASLTLSHITKKYPNGFEAVKDFNLDIADKEFIIFVGPSGCGKSTTLRILNGLAVIMLTLVHCRTGIQNSICKMLLICV